MQKDLCSGMKPGPGGGMMIIAIALIAAGCSIKKPVAPSWEVVLNVPLFSRWFDVTDFFDDEDFTLVNGDSLLTIDHEEPIDPVEVGDEVTIEDFDESISQVIGTFSVPSPPPQIVPFPLSSLYPPAAGGSGGVPVAIPPFSFSGIQQDMPAFDMFTHVVIDTGTVTLQVTNNMGIDFDTLGVHLLDEGAGNAVVMTVDITAGGPLPNGATRILQRSLAGVSTGNDMLLEAFGHSPGATVVLDGSESMDIVATMGEVRVSSATAEVGAIDFSYPDSLAIPGGSTITSAILSSGAMTLSLNNQLPVPLDIQVELHDLTDYWNNPVSINLAAPANSSDSDLQDLSDHTVTPVDDGSGGQIITLDVTVHSDGSQGGQVTLSSTDSVSVRTQVTDLVINSIQGILESTTVDIPVDGFELTDEDGNLLDEVRKITFSAVDLELTVRHTIGFPAHLELFLTGEGGSPDPVNLNITMDLNPGSDSVPDTSTMILNEGNPNVLDFLNAFPSTIRYSGQVTVGDGITVGSVSSTSFFEADIRFSTPLMLNVNQPIRIELDEEFIEEGLEFDEDVAVIQEASLRYSLASTMGIEVSSRMTAAADSNLVYSNPDVELLLTLQSPHTTVTDTVITLSREQLDVLKEPFYFGAWISIPSTGGTPFRVAKSDRIFISALVKVRALIDPESDDEGGGGR